MRLLVAFRVALPSYKYCLGNVQKLKTQECVIVCKNEVFLGRNNWFCILISIVGSNKLEKTLSRLCQKGPNTVGT